MSQESTDSVNLRHLNQFVEVTLHDLFLWLVCKTATVRKCSFLHFPPKLFFY